MMAGLTKQHFNKIAGIINKGIKQGEVKKDMGGFSFLDNLIEYFKTQNPLFNENQFRKACLE